MKKNQYVFENRIGQVVRTIEAVESKFIVVYRRDSKRIETFPSEDSLRGAKFSYTILAEIKEADLKRGPVSLGKWGKVRLAEDEQKLSPSFVPTPESNDKYNHILKVSSLSYLVVVALLIIIGRFVSTEPEKTEETIVYVVPQSVRERITVDVSEKPVVEKKIARKASVAKRASVETKIKPKVQNLQQAGALGILGSVNKMSNRAGGIQVNNNSTRGGAMGSSADAGQVSHSLYGQALIAANKAQSTSSAVGAGAYGTKGKGGGRSGYGTISLVGASSGYFQPLAEEAIVNGGLDRAQIAEVINRNKGQITYCYEKGLQSSPGLSGRVAIKFVINGDGYVSVAGVSQSSLSSKTVEGCIVARLKGWKFPQPVGRVNVRVTYPFVLTRVGQG